MCSNLCGSATPSTHLSLSAFRTPSRLKSDPNRSITTAPSPVSSGSSVFLALVPVPHRALRRVLDEPAEGLLLPRETRPAVVRVHLEVAASRLRAGGAAVAAAAAEADRDRERVVRAHARVRERGGLVREPSPAAREDHVGRAREGADRLA
eukprot:31342-Pelagococcus_subviridis.AAC.25